jgi:hypothetical protein
MRLDNNPCTLGVPIQQKKVRRIEFQDKTYTKQLLEPVRMLHEHESKVGCFRFVILLYFSLKLYNCTFGLEDAFFADCLEPNEKIFSVK